MSSQQHGAAGACARGINERLPSVIGWLSQSNTFTAFTKACAKGNASSDRKIYVAKVNDHSNVDGGFIVDPPSSFPSEDPTSVCLWVQQRKDDANPPMTIRFDAKLNMANWTRGQWAHLIILTLPDYPDYYCLLPYRSYANLHAVHRRTSTNYGYDSRLDWRTQGRRNHTFTSYLAPFAVHVDDIFQALKNVVTAVVHETWYVNPTNKVEFHGWKVPKPDYSFLPLLRTTQVHQRLSATAIQRITELLQSGVGTDMKVVQNPAEPLVCDFTLLDERSNISYLVEHKCREQREGLNLMVCKHEWRDPRSNWHFLLHHCGDKLAIFTREAPRIQDTEATPPILIDLNDANAASDLVEHIRARGDIARNRLCSKWEHFDVYDDSVPVENGLGAPVKSDQPSTNSTQARSALKTEIRRFALAFEDAFNKQCFKFGSLCCILLDNFPSADAAILQHTWTRNDFHAYEHAGRLPVSLVGNSMADVECIQLRFIPHFHQSGTVSTSKAFELSMQAGFEIPACPAQEFIYIATTGGVPAIGQDDNLDSLVLLPSDATTMLNNTLSCETCDNPSKQRVWTYVTPTISKPDLKQLSIISEKKGLQIPLTAAPYLLPSAEPLKRIFSFSNGDVHRYFETAFETPFEPYHQAIWTYWVTSETMEPWHLEGSSRGNAG